MSLRIRYDYFDSLFFTPAEYSKLKLTFKIQVLRATIVGEIFARFFAKSNILNCGIFYF